MTWRSVRIRVWPRQSARRTSRRATCGSGVTDLVMPEVTGLELCRELKREPATAEIPVIACTTKDRKIDQNWAKKQGVSAYVTKPFTEEQLISAVQAVAA